MEMQCIQIQLQGVVMLFDGFVGLVKGYVGEQFKVYKVLFVVSKVFSVVQVVMFILIGFVKVQELGFLVNLVEMVWVVVIGVLIIFQINGVQFVGVYDQGGQILVGKVGIVGEYGLELVKGLVLVCGRELIGWLYLDGGNQFVQMVLQVYVKNVNVLDLSLVGDYFGMDEGEKFIMNVVNCNKSLLGY